MILEQKKGKGHHTKYNYKAIIETFTKVRNLKRELVELHKETDKNIQRTKMQHFGDVLTDIVMPDLETSETESSVEINFIIGKIKHTFAFVFCFQSVRMAEGFPRTSAGAPQSSCCRTGGNPFPAFPPSQSSRHRQKKNL